MKEKRKVSQETRDKIAAANKGKTHSEETRLKLSRSLTGRVLSEEARQKVSATTKAAMARPEVRAKVLEANQKRRGTTASQETREKQSKSGKRSYEHGNLRQKRAESSRNSWVNPEMRQKRMERIHSQEVRDRQSEHMRERWEGLSLEERNAILGPRRAKAWRDKPTKIEIAVCECLALMGVEYEAQYLIGGCCVDVYIPNQNHVIEVQGCYWHGCKECGFDAEWHTERRNVDRHRRMYLRSEGFRVSIIWEHDVKNNLDVCLKTLLTQEDTFVMGYKTP